MIGKQRQVFVLLQFHEKSQRTNNTATENNTFCFECFSIYTAKYAGCLFRFYYIAFITVLCEWDNVIYLLLSKNLCSELLSKIEIIFIKSILCVLLASSHAFTAEFAPDTVRSLSVAIGIF